MRLPCRHRHAKAKQHGAALMIMIVILVMGIVAALIGALSLSALQSARQEKTSAALAQAKEALIGKSITYDDYPGSLPCPDTDNDGVSDAGGSSECPNYIGRLPWKTLGLPDLRDGDGEQLWYTMSRNFRRYDLVRPLNSNTKGTLLVYGPDGVTLQTAAGYDAAAIIFSPGSALNSQTRNTATEQNSAANYLDTANSRNNASSSGPFIAGALSATFNDQLLFITTKDLMPLVEQRVAGVVKKALTDYFAANGYYPWADTVAAAVDYNANEGLNRGWLPDVALTANTPDWPVNSIPQWFLGNRWYTLIYYSVAQSRSGPGGCISCTDSTLSINGTSGRALFFMPGTPIGVLTRTINKLDDYLEDPENNDNANDLYVTPTSQAKDRDRLYWLSSSSTWNQ